DAVFLGCRFDAPPGRISLGLADILDLIESRDGIATCRASVKGSLRSLGNANFVDGISRSACELSGCFPRLGSRPRRRRDADAATARLMLRRAADFCRVVAMTLPP